MITRSGHDKEATCSEGNRNQAELRKDDRGGVTGREEMNETDRAGGSEVGERQFKCRRSGGMGDRRNEGLGSQWHGQRQLRRGQMPSQTGPSPGPIASISAKDMAHGEECAGAGFNAISSESSSSSGASGTCDVCAKGGGG